MKEKIGRLCGLVSLILFRLSWQVEPTFFFCVSFWMAVGVTEFVDWRIYKRPFTFSSMLVNLGFLSNAAVTISNNGKMPCLGKLGNPTSIWTPATSQHHLLPLCDRFFGFAVGDFLIVAGLFLSIAFSVSRALIPGAR